MRQTGAHQAADELLREYAAPLQRVARAYAPFVDRARHLFQEIALALGTALLGFCGHSSERTWLYRVAQDTAIRFATKRMLRARYEEPCDSPDQISSANPERSAIDNQQRQIP